MSSKLPSNWVWAKMLDILEYEGGSQPPKKDFIYEPRKGYVRLLQIRDFGDKPLPTYVPNSKRLKKVKTDNLLIARYGGSSSNSNDSLGRICTGLEGAYNVALAKIIFPNDLLDLNYVKYLFRGPWFKEKVSLNSRSCQTGFNRGDVVDIKFPLAPLNEQRRIAKKLELLLGKVDSNQRRLVMIPLILERFRKAILAAACSGRLTVDWRGGILRNNGLPSTWTQRELRDLCELITKGASPKWQGVNYSDRGVLFVTSENVGTGNLLLNTRKYVEPKINKIQPRSVLRKGDLLTNIVGASIGRSAIFDLDDVANINQAVALIRLKKDIERKYILYVLNSPSIIEHMNSEKVDVARANLSLKDVASFPIPLPPIAEQQEIVRRVELLFKLANQIEARYNKAKAQVDKLTQSILAKAFRGELVEQDPNDEPANVLLERIKKK